MLPTRTRVSPPHVGRGPAWPRAGRSALQADSPGPPLMVTQVRDRRISARIRAARVRCRNRPAARTDGVCGQHNYCITLTLLDTGMRLSELVGLMLDGLKLQEGYCRVTPRERKRGSCLWVRAYRRFCGSM